MAQEAKQIETKQAQAEQISWSWLRSISRSLFDLDSKPLLGSAPDFPWKTFTATLAKTLGIDSLNITPGALDWKDAKAIQDTVKTPFRTCVIHIQSIEPSCYVLINESDIQSLMENVLHTDCAPNNIPDGFFEGFYYFFLAQCVFSLNETDFGKKIPVKIKNMTDGIQEELRQAMLCQDIWVSMNDRKFLVCVAMPQEFQKAFRSFSQSIFSRSQAPKLDQISVKLHAEIGRSHLTFNEWKEMNAGDFIYIEDLLYEPGTDKTKCLITFEGKPLFRCKVKDEGFKILEIPTHDEVYTYMTDQTKIGQPPKNTPGHSHAGDKASDFLSGVEDEFELQENSAANAAPTRSEQTQKGQNTEQDTEEESPTPFGNIPVTLVVELAHVETTVHKLLQLQPGNMIDIGISPQNNVMLTINGRVVGRGEILKIGDTLGVRLIEVGPK